MKKLGVIITDGVGFRNFILSDFLVEAENAYDEVIRFSTKVKKSKFNSNNRNA